MPPRNPESPSLMKTTGGTVTPLEVPLPSAEAVPSNSARHLSNTCRSRYSSGRPCWPAPDPASAPWCPPLLCSPSAAYAEPHSAVGCEFRCPPVPRFPAASSSEPCAFGLLFPAFLLPQLACVASAPHAFHISRKHSAYAQTNQPKLWSRCALAATPQQPLEESAQILIPLLSACYYSETA
ncbi:uncharacterized protein PGTG_11562 [Puccinia graminis f. sp. tritici CRL 75-36-700-3]|uniref:Uncharacterized protein n=1 Tax=Puccinia graminis f. sp. tritici (strain CRL 75-36-700-3 / race SCCL) TaxID=418459 RepID=E3KM44_PUCGT|nr:uncharacterized protein PGTG_11562 [Puccinia graminis f. sp. tritici CRL 75-36-700-3]EFP85393.2 hypothetical protein PGTG_11562 [Puccinia graminis f. sp. tritici CRL 75-36-700-3]